MSSSVGRRGFIKRAAGLGGLAVAGAQILQAGRPESKGKTVAGLRTPAMDVVRVGIIGVGSRGGGHLGHMLVLEGVEVKAICDINEGAAKRAIRECWSVTIWTWLWLSRRGVGTHRWPSMR